ncbi:tetratricopeptide repeat protein, partial [Candidatus Saccharibacteria bacterium]|nr:tetratricopeptide repeat protein [Candidatus Saccharibacteria bacterium]
NKLVAEKPGDARVHVFFSTFYRALGNLDEAATQMDIARELSPRKQSIIMQQAIIKYSQGDMEKAKELFREAFILDERNDEAREYYAAMLFAIGEADSAKALITEDRIMDRFAMNDFILSSVNSAGDTVFLSELYESRIKQQPDSAQNWASLAFLYYQNKDNEAAISTLESAKTQIPTFAKAANCFIDNIKAGNEPQEGCQN